MAHRNFIIFKYIIFSKNFVLQVNFFFFKYIVIKITKRRIMPIYVFFTEINFRKFRFQFNHRNLLSLFKTKLNYFSKHQICYFVEIFIITFPYHHYLSWEWSRDFSWKVFSEIFRLSLDFSENIKRAFRFGMSSTWRSESFHFCYFKY